MHPQHRERLFVMYGVCINILCIGIGAYVVLHLTDIVVRIQRTFNINQW